MAGTLIHITDAGRAALVAPGNTGTTARKVVEIGLSNAPFDDTNKGLVKLPNEIKRISTFGGDNVAPDLIHVTLKDDTADKYTLYGFGLYFDNGVLFGVYSQATPIMEKSPAALLLLTADMLFTTIDATQLVFGPATFLNPPATTERQGVIELATQAEVNAGADDTRAVTPKTAAARYAALTGAIFTGPVNAIADVGETDAQFVVKGPSGTNSREGKQRFYGTFGSNNVDTGTRLIASIRAGFNNGSWGKEYLDFWLNYGAANDAQKDSLQARVLRLVAGGRALFNTATDDGTNIAQFGGNVSTRGVHTFGYGATVGWATSDATVAYFRANGHVSVGSESPAGFLDLYAGNAARARVLPSGRVLFGTTNDDGSSLVQVAGNGRFAGEVQSTAANQFRAVYGNYGAIMRNDGTNVYFLQTASGDPYGTWNAFRPLSWGLSDGAVRIDMLGASTTFGGPVIISKGDGIAQPLAIRAKAGEQRNFQFQTGSTNRWQIMADSSAESGSNAGSDFYIQAFNDAGAWSLNPFVIKRNTGRVLLQNGVDVTGMLSVNRANGEGQAMLGQNDGYFYGNASQAGWYSGTKGSWSYNFATKNLYVNDSAVWHAGNLSPLDVNKGGTLNNDVYFADGKRIFLSEGSAGSPSLTFQNDGAPDTGLYHVNDGTFAVTCNSTRTVRFTPTLTAFDKPLTGPTPAAGDVSTLIPTTEWVTAAIGSATIGQIVMEPRTSARAGYLKANGALVKRADYPALWLYAQASGALVTEAAWTGGSWGCFSSGDGVTTFRIPELRGEHLRCWDDGRGVDGSRAIGSWQDSQNRSHTHGASAGAVGDHVHGAWTDAQGFHGHGVSDGGHSHVTGINAKPAQAGNSGPGYFGPAGGGVNQVDQWGSSVSGSNIGINGDGSHGHNVGIGAGGNHNHPITVNADGGAEARVRTVALLAMIRAY